MIQATHTHSSVMNCSPIKPHNTQSFGRSSAIEATADWLEDIQDGDLSEGKFRDLTDVADKMSDGPLKTFVKILAIGGGAFVAAKVGSAKIINNLTKNSVVSNNVVQPLTKFVHHGLDKVAARLQKSKFFGEQQKGFKPFIVNTLAKAVDSIKLYGKRGAEEIEANLSAQIKDLKAKSQGLTEVEKLDYKKQIKTLNERKKYAPTENLLKKVTSTTAGAGAGTVAVVEANRDADENGIADIGEHRVA